MEQVLKEIQHFFNQYPKTKQKLFEWEMKNMLGTQEQMANFLREQGEEDISSPEITMDMVEQVCYSSFILNPRFLYEFFDPAGIFVIARRDEDKWYFELDGEKDETEFKDRITAEAAGFKKAIIKYENRENGEQN